MNFLSDWQILLLIEIFRDDTPESCRKGFFERTMKIFLMLLVVAVSATEWSGLHIICAEENYSQVVPVFSEICNISAQNCILVTVQVSNYVVFNVSHNQSLYELIIDISADPSRNAKLGDAGVSSVSGVTQRLLFPPPLTASPNGTAAPYVEPLRPVTPSPASPTVSTGGIIGISVSMTIVLFILIGSFSKWYIWKLDREYLYAIKQEEEARETAQTVADMDTFSIVPGRIAERTEQEASENPVVDMPPHTTAVVQLAETRPKEQPLEQLVVDTFCDNEFEFELH